jgi:hypothetical protein
MGLKEFVSLQLTDKKVIIRNANCLVAFREDEQYKIILYKIESFYIEVFYSVLEDSVITKIDAFDTAERLEPYVFRKALKAKDVTKKYKIRLDILSNN